jgi:hypothetical protein
MLVGNELVHRLNGGIGLADTPAPFSDFAAREVASPVNEGSSA